MAPRGSLPTKPRSAARLEIVDLDHHAVGFIGQLIAALIPGYGIGDGIVDIVEAAGDIGNWETQGFQIFQ